MKQLFLPLLLSFLFFTRPFNGSSQTANQQDSLALVDLYNSTNGPGWLRQTNWLTKAPLYSWSGLSTINGRTNAISLRGNRLIGTLPSSLANLTGAAVIDLSFNQLTGSIPASFNNFSGQSLDLSNNQLSGNLPPFSNLKLSLVDLQYNRFTFTGTETVGANSLQKILLGNQADIPLITNGNILSVAAGGTLSNNTYTWYKDGVNIATHKGDSTFTSSSPGIYSVQVANSIVQGFTLYSIGSVVSQDSLAVVDLYNATGGSHWANTTNWLTTAPLDTWYGVTVRNGRVQELQLSSNYLTGNLPPSIGNLTALTNLQLFGNQLSGALQQALTQCSSLSALSLGANQYSGNLPPWLGDLSVAQLDLSNNRFNGEIPSSIANDLYLSSLQLFANQLTGNIPATLGRLSRLSTLVLSNNQLTGTIPDSLATIQSLTYLDFQNNLLNGPLPSGFKNKPMNHFFIQYNHFDFSGMENLPLTPGGPGYYPQTDIPIHQKGDSVYVSAGGIPINDTFVLYKNGVFVGARGGDSAFKITGPGKYNILSYNTIATLLTLYSDTLVINAVLPDSTITASQVITGGQPTDLETGIFKLLTLTPTPGPNALSGNVTALVSVDSVVATFNGQPYVQRHYDVTPSDNASTAQATVTLYFTQQDFDAFNTYVSTHNLGIPSLPVNGIDNGNVRITQYHGLFNGTANPANYTQGTTVIIPTVAWDAANNWWTVSFPVTGFSGFFLSSNGIPLPLALLQFTGVLQGSSVNLQWRTTHEINTRQFTVQRSSDAVLFSPVGTVAASSTPGVNGYSFTDNDPVKGTNFYQLKMIDIDGHYTYSPIIKVNADISSAALYAYPNPARNTTSLLFNAGTPGKYNIEVTDLSGKKMSRLTGTSFKGLNKVDIDLHAYAAGIYTLTITDEEHGQRTLRLFKE